MPKLPKTTKTCKACGETKDLSEFYRVTPLAPDASPYYQARCKECEKAHQRARYRAKRAAFIQHKELGRSLADEAEGR